LQFLCSYRVVAVIVYRRAGRSLDGPASRFLNLWVGQWKGREVEADVPNRLVTAPHEIARSVQRVGRQRAHNTLSVPGEQIGLPVLVPEHFNEERQPGRKENRRRAKGPAMGWSVEPCAGPRELAWPAGAPSVSVQRPRGRTETGDSLSRGPRRMRRRQRKPKGWLLNRHPPPP
jgi:hypothetical protein